MGKASTNMSEDQPQGSGWMTPACKRCGSETVVKFGTRKGRQRYLCQGCQGTFTDNGAAPGMRIREEVAELARELAGLGISLRAVQRMLDEQHGVRPSVSTIFRWVKKGAEEGSDGEPG